MPRSGYASPVLRTTGAAFLVLFVVHRIQAESSTAVQELATIRATKVGVDAQNNFWAWDARRHVVTRITPAGDRFESDILPNGIAIDADQQRGIAMLDNGGRMVYVIDWNGKQKRSLHLLNQATDIAWLSGSRLGVTPKLASHRAEVWDASTGEYIATIGPCPQIVPPKPGAVAARAGMIRYDAAHQEIVTFDSFRGDMAAFTESGAPTREGHVDFPRAAEIASWLNQMDASARNHGESKTPVIQNYPTMTISSDRTIWLGEDSDARGVTAVEFLGDGTIRRIKIDTPQCPSIRFGEWNSSFVFFRDPVSPQPQCVAVVRRKG